MMTASESYELIDNSGPKTPLQRFYNSCCYTRKAKALWALFGAVVLVIVIVIPTLYATNAIRPKEIRKYPNIIFIVTDGFGPASATLARVTAKVANLSGYQNGLHIDNYITGTVQTYSSDSWVTDSAAGATAYACALKTYNGAIGVDPLQKPCGTLMEAAQAAGMKTGFVVTSRVTHATPGSFTSHAVDRDMEQFIALQQVNGSFDLMFGGGLSEFVNRDDNIDLIKVAEDKGYTIVQNVTEMNALDKLPAIGLFASSHMSFEIDRNPAVLPSLSAMVTKALSLLSQSESGFFLLIEGSRIDMAGHNNDAGTQYHEVIAYDQAFETAIEFAKKDGNTFVVASSDHETGGLTLGFQYPTELYPPYAWYPAQLLQQTASSEIMDSLISKGQNISQVVQTYANITLTEAEIAKIASVPAGASRTSMIGNVISAYSRVGWTTWGHTGVDVNLYTYGPHSEGLHANMNNIDVGAYVANTFKLDIEAITKKIADFNPNPPEVAREADPYHDRSLTK